MPACSEKTVLLNDAIKGAYNYLLIKPLAMVFIID
jgi:hypothetical protein